MKQSDITALSDEQLCSACSGRNGAMGELLRNTEICMEDGCRVPYAGLSIGGGGDGQIDVRYSFGMPLDRERVTGLDISGQMISLAT